MLFDEPTRRRIVQIIARMSSHTDSLILAYAIMPNHLHLVVQQGRDPLARLMQPTLRRIALLVQKSEGIEGHVFERRFRAHPCLDAAYVRDAIVYTHLNPVRAGMCDHPAIADATSHGAYTSLSGSENPAVTFLAPARELFSRRKGADPAQWRRDYDDYVAYRQACDRADAAERSRPPDPPPCDAGDEYFAANYAVSVSPERIIPSRRIDLRDLALCAVAVKHHDLALDALRGRNLYARELQELRYRIIRQAARAGHSGVAIASFFRMSPSRVSEVIRSAPELRAMAERVNSDASKGGP